LNFCRGDIRLRRIARFDPSRIISSVVAIDASSARAGGATRMFEASFAPLSNADNAHCSCASRRNARTIRNGAT
jgi:hypothetical protein